MKKVLLTTCICMLLIANSAAAAVHRVPDDFPTIQAAIDAAQDFDTVILAPQTYTGFGNYNISLRGKKITVTGTDPADWNVVESTVIDGAGRYQGFRFYWAETPEAKVTGIKITNCYGFLGGAIYCYNNSSPTIANCAIVANSGIYGGAICCTNTYSRPTITNCRILANSASGAGGAIYCNAASPAIRNCTISGNFAPQGGAVYAHNPGTPLLLNSTVSTNSASLRAGALYCFAASNLSVSNSILSNNQASYAPQILVGFSGATTTAEIAYSDIRNRTQSVLVETGSTLNWAQGNIDVDPCFVQPGSWDGAQTTLSGDYHLIADSACIDAGDPDFAAEPSEADIDADARIMGQAVDIGADEFRSAALVALVNAKPNTLNLDSNLKWIFCDIKLPDGYDIADVDLSSIRLAAQLQPVWSVIDEYEAKVAVKFDRSHAEPLITAQQPPSVNISGKLNDGTSFAGSDTIRIKQANAKAKHK